MINYETLLTVWLMEHIQSGPSCITQYNIQNIRRIGVFKDARRVGVRMNDALEPYRLCGPLWTASPILDICLNCEGHSCHRHFT